MKTLKQTVLTEEAKRLYQSDLPETLVIQLSADLIIEYAVEEYLKSQETQTTAPRPA